MNDSNREKKLFNALLLILGVFIVGCFSGYTLAGVELIHALSTMDKSGFGACVLPSESKEGKL
ncbi:hypothetical protein V2P20_02425 [Methylobacter sp. Wu1]|jgi:hypothetical protein|uniref:hypothetical protein n=1 Tax=Methylobacter sp. Wu1 TaxID=3119359 RepID=UPI002F93902C